ncbi:hypothetical protein [Nocardia xishanensis]|uniref:hypothetical protein n=1 Tax=Nocardia xishanensis TaxID=238964 RepID=UPI0034371425
MQELFLTHTGLAHGRVWVAKEGAAVAVRPAPATDAGPVFAWFLGTVGVDPDSQGRGLGAAVFRPGLAAVPEVPHATRPERRLSALGACGESSAVRLRREAQR